MNNKDLHSNDRFSRNKYNVQLRKNNAENESYKATLQFFENKEIAPNTAADGTSYSISGVTAALLDVAKVLSNPEYSIDDKYSKGVLVIRNYASVDTLHEALCSTKVIHHLKALVVSGCFDAYPNYMTAVMWIFANLCSGNTATCNEILSDNFLPVIISYLNPENQVMCDYAVFACANLIGESPGIRYLAVDLGILDKLFNILSTYYVTNHASPCIKDVYWCLNNIFRSASPAVYATYPLPSVENFIPFIEIVLNFIRDGKISSSANFHAWWFLARVLKVFPDIIVPAIRLGLIPCLVDRLYDSQIQFTYHLSGFRIANCLATIEDDIVFDSVYNSNLIQALIFRAVQFLDMTSNRVLGYISEILFGLSNFIFLAPQTYRYKIHSTEVLSFVVSMTKHSSYQIVKEAMFCINNYFEVTHTGAIYSFLATYTDIYSIFADCLGCPNTDVTINTLHTITALCASFEQSGDHLATDQILTKFIESGVNSKLEDLVLSSNEEIRDLTDKFINLYLIPAGEDDDFEF